MTCLVLRPWCARRAWIALAFGIQSLSAAEAAAPVTVGAPAFLDRVGQVWTGPTMAVAGNGQGLVAMVWAASRTVLQARVYDALGPPRTPVFEVTREATDLSIVQLAVDGSGGILVAWVRGANPYGNPTTLVARRYGWDGSPATPELIIGTGSLAFAAYSSFAFSLAADGSFLAAYQKPASPGPGSSLVVQAFGAGGQAEGLENSISTAPDPTFASVVLGRREEDAVVAFGKLGAGETTTGVWARRLDRLGTPLSAEIAAVPAIPGYGHVPSGVALYPGGRFALGYQVCDPLPMDFLCVAAGIQWIGSDDSLLPDSDPADRLLHSAYQSWLVQDPQGNPFAFTADDGVGNFRAANPLGAVVSKTAVATGLPRPPYPGSSYCAGLVPLGPATVGLVWHLSDWTYLQTITVGSETTAAPSFHTIAPCRLIDTRQGGTAFRAGEDRAIQASGLCSIPVGARTLAANVVSVGSTDAGDVRSYRADRLVPPTSVLNYGAGQVRASQTLIPLSDDGALALRATQGKGTTHLIIDVSGYFQ